MRRALALTQRAAVQGHAPALRQLANAAAASGEAARAKAWFAKGVDDFGDADSSTSSDGGRRRPYEAQATADLARCAFPAIFFNLVGNSATVHVGSVNPYGGGGRAHF